MRAGLPLQGVKIEQTRESFHQSVVVRGVNVIFTRAKIAADAPSNTWYPKHG